VKSQHKLLSLFYRYEMIGQAGRLGQSITGVTAQHGLDGRAEIGAVTHADEDRSHAVTGAQNGPYDLAAIGQCGP
jgi:hypothetical protein